MHTPQEAALDALEKKYGRNHPAKEANVITEDHVGFRLVGVRRPEGYAGKARYIVATGSTWREALGALGQKVKA